MGLLTEKGRNQIAENLLQSGMIANTINLVATNNTVGITDFFDETDKSYQTYQGIKETIAKDPSLAKMLQNPNLKPEQKEQMLNQIADSVMVKLGYTTYDTKLIDTTNTGRDGKQIKGFYSTETNKAYINDQNNNSTAALVTTAGHEATRAMDDQNKENFDKKRDDRNDYAQTFGENLASYTNMALNINGYNQGMATENNRIGNATNPIIEQNNDDFRTLDKNKGDNSEFSPESVEEFFRWTLWRDTGLQAEEVPQAIAESIKEDTKIIVKNIPTVLGAAALAVPHPGVKAVLSTSSIIAGVVQDVDNGDVNNTLGSGIGSLAQTGLGKIGVLEPIADKVNFGISEIVSRKFGKNDE
jgi:hypothetical protein